MRTPIVDFVNGYVKTSPVRMHMPGHKGKGDIERFDITEISGADSLYEASGIIAESEKKASELFGADTFYSTEGSSLSIRAMLYLTTLYAKSKGVAPRVLAARNAHKVFIYAAALLDISVGWFYPQYAESHLACPLTAEDMKTALDGEKEKPCAVYLTSPDYLGNILDISSIARICHERGVLLLVDNAHGAYLKFLERSIHPIDLGADICCDSAHKTLPTLTGGAYLHISKNAPSIFKENAKSALALFGSTSPSYLILASLDKTNRLLATEFGKALRETVGRIEFVKKRLISLGYKVLDTEPMKITLAVKPYGYTGKEIADILEQNGIFCEFADEDNLVLMPSPNNDEKDFCLIQNTFENIAKRDITFPKTPKMIPPKSAMSAHNALLSVSEILPTRKCEGRVLASPCVSCPPAVPILVMGELIDKAAIEMFEYYGIKTLQVVKNN